MDNLGQLQYEYPNNAGAALSTVSSQFIKATSHNPLENLPNSKYYFALLATIR